MIYSIENEHLKVEINDLGAELWSIYNKKTDSHLLWQGDPEVWPRRSPSLFPVCSVTHDPKMPQHGFIRDYTHTVEEQTDTLIVFKCTHNDETLAIYPYKFSFYTVYSIVDNVLHNTFKIINDTDGVLPFSVGFHSGFYANDTTVLQFQTAEICPNVMQNDDSFCSGKLGHRIVGMQNIPMSADFFPGCTILKDQQSTSITVVTDDKPVLKFDFVGFPFLAIWTIERPIKFVCLEPWHGTPDPAEPYPKFEHKPNLVTLPMGETFACTQCITAL